MILAVSDSLENYLGMATWYRDRRIANAVIRAFGESLKECDAKGKRRFVAGREVLASALTRSLNTLRESNTNWSDEMKRLKELGSQAKSNARQATR
jgi:hypothetical protein